MSSPTDIVDGYLAIILDDASQKQLLAAFPPKYPKVFAHHVTIIFKPTRAEYDLWKQYIGQQIPLRVFGYAEDDKGQAIMVDADILKGRKHHITISTNNVPPAYSQKLLEKGFQEIAEPFVLNGEFTFVEHVKR